MLLQAGVVARGERLRSDPLRKREERCEAKASVAADARVRGFAARVAPHEWGDDRLTEPFAEVESRVGKPEPVAALPRGDHRLRRAAGALRSSGRRDPSTAAGSRRPASARPRARGRAPLHCRRRRSWQLRRAARSPEPEARARERRGARPWRVARPESRLLRASSARQRSRRGRGRLCPHQSPRRCAPRRARDAPRRRPLRAPSCRSAPSWE